MVHKIQCRESFCNLRRDSEEEEEDAAEEGRKGSWEGEGEGRG